MRFVSQWSYGCAKHLAGAMNENHQKRSVYYYGFFIVIGALVKGAITLSVALLLGVLIPTLLITFAFGSLRMLAGGYHMDTYGKCLFVSLGLFIASAVISQYTYLYWSTLSVIAFITVTFIIGLYVLIRYAPKDTPNKRITEPQVIRKFKRLSIVYLCAWFFATGVLSFYKLNMFAIALSFGVLLELFAISPIGHKFFDLLKDKMDHKKTSSK